MLDNSTSLPIERATGSSMQQGSLSGSPTDTNSVLKLSRPFWLLLAISFLCLTGLAGLLTHLQNSNAIQTSRHLFLTALENRLERMGELVLEYGFWDEAVTHLVTRYDPEWALSNFGSYSYETLGVFGVHVLDASNRPVMASVKGVLVEADPLDQYGPDLAAMVAEARATERDIEPVPVVGYLTAGDRFYLGAAVLMTTYGVQDGEEVDISTDHVMVFTEELSDGFLETVADRFLIPELRFGEKPDGLWAAGQVVSTYDGRHQTPFTWAPQLPGSDMLPILMAGLTVVFLLMLATAWAFVRQANAMALTLQAARREADRANRAKTEFLRNVTHEIRTPTTAILGFSGVMRDEMFGPLGDPKYREYADDISRAGDHVLDLVNDLLDLEKIEAGEVQIFVQLIEPNQLVRAGITYIEGLARDRRIAIELQLADALPPVRSDPRAVQQILLNLLSNAIKFTPPGGTVVCRTRLEDDETLLIQVADNGPGLSETDIAKALQPFGQIRIPNSAPQRGSGLGLPISKRLTETLGGEFRFESRLGKGTTVTLALPLHPTLPGDRFHSEDDTVNNSIGAA